MKPEPAGTVTSEGASASVRARFGSSEVPASRATQDRIDIPEFAPNLLPEGDIRPDRFLDRELSWLAFNSRVLELAEDPTLHLLERVAFLSIFASNLDEFFMVRVAGLKRRIATGLAVPSPAGLSPVEVLEKIGDEAHRLQQRHAQVYAEQIRPALAYEHIHLMHWDELDDAAKQQLSAMFAEKVFPILTPLAVDPAHPFPYISGLSLNLAVVVRNPVSDKELFARLKVPDQLPRLISIDGPRAGAIPGRVARFIALEEVIAVHLDKLFAGMEVLEHHIFRVTRNEDLEVEEDDAENLLQALEKELLRRRFGPPVRLEVTHDINPNIRALLIRELGVEESEVYSLPAPLDLRGLSVIAGIDRADLHYPKHMPHTSRFLNESETSKAANVFSAMRRRDILLHHPYDSFSTSVQAFLEQAAADPKVQAIKQTLYRTSGDSPIVDALIDAAEAGKQVLVIVEIKARFDEEANIRWARKLEQAGCHVVYGLVGLKTHCKLAMVVRDEPEGIRRYTHIGTGNYNGKTARLYEDLGLITTNEVIGEDVAHLFNNLSGYSRNPSYDRLLVAPDSARTGLVERIHREIEHHLNRRPARIRFKANSVVDEALIDALYLASQSGVPVQMQVRGICALRPGVPGLSENIEVRSIVGRFLEHSRIFWFENGGDPSVWIGSADLMHRNLDRRVEVLVQVPGEGNVNQVGSLLDLAFSPDTHAWMLESGGAWAPNSGRVHLQEALIEQQRRPRAVP